MTDCPDDWREQIFNPRHPVIPWLRIKDFKLVSLKMIVSSMLLHQRRKIKKDLTRRLLLQALDQNTPDKTPADSDAAHVSHTGERGFPSALHRLRLTTVSRHSLSGSGVATPACKQSSSGATLSDMHEEWIDGVCVPNTQMAEEPDSDAGGDTGGDAGGGVASQPSAPNALIQRVLAMGTLGKEPASSATQAEPASLAPSRSASLAGPTAGGGLGFGTAGPAAKPRSRRPTRQAIMGRAAMTGWFYIDDFKETQGPFSTGKMRGWISKGYLSNERFARPANSSEDAMRAIWAWPELNPGAEVAQSKAKVHWRKARKTLSVAAMQARALRSDEAF